MSFDHYHLGILIHSTATEDVIYTSRENKKIREKSLNEQSCFNSKIQNIEQFISAMYSAN